MVAHKIEIGNYMYDTHITRKECCERQPTLFGGSRSKGFLREGYYYFECDICGRAGESYITSNGASGLWNDDVIENPAMKTGLVNQLIKE